MNDARAQIRPALRWLQRARTRARAALLTQRAGHLAAGALAIAIIAGLVDFVFRFPEALRILALATGVGAILVLLWKRLVPAFRFKPCLSSIALRAEAQQPELKGVLAAAVDFANERDPDSPGLARGLSDLVIADAAKRFHDNPPRSMVNARPALASLGKALVVVALGAVLYAQSPTLFAIGAQRVLAPWSGAEWPKRTAVVDVTSLDVHPRGAAIPLRAALVKTTRDPEDASVFVDYRPIPDENRYAPTRTALLTYQGRAVDTPASPREGALSGKGALFERLVEADATAIEYRFRTADDQTPWTRVRLIEPPAVRAATANITPPDYAAALLAAQGDESESSLASARTALDLGAGRDERAIAPPALAGSRVELTLALNKPLPPPTSIDRGFLASVFGEQLASIPDARLSTDAQTWTLAFTLPSSVRIPVALRDEFGIESPDPAIFRFDAVDDREPGVSITDPQNDLHVLPTATVPVVAEARDDVGLSAVWVTMQRFTPEGASGPGGALKPAGDPDELSVLRTAGLRETKVSATVDLEALSAQPGEEFQLFGLALDIRMNALAAGSLAAAPSRSQPRRLRVISEAEFIEEIRSELASVRADAIRAEQQQREVQSQTQTRGSDRVTRRGQSLVTERLARQREAIQRLAERIERNNLEDARLSELLAEADASLQRAGESASSAQQTLDQAAQQRRDELARAGEQPPPPGDETADLDDEQSRDTDQDQQEVRDQLSDLIGLLDAGEDNWVARRSLERLLDEQRALREDTAQTGAQTAGAELDQLTPEQRASLQDLAQRQRELAEQTRQTAEELRERAEQLQQNDPDAAAGMREAARRLEQARTSETQQQAAQNTQQNRTNDANQQQDQASQSIQQALDSLERGEDARRDQLRRRLASIIESLRVLVAQQESEIARLNDNAPNLDQSMIALNRNTLGVLDLANAGGRELAPVARLVARASDAQGEAITALRARPAPDLAGALDAEQRSLVALREALDTAQRLEDQQQQIENRRMLAQLRQRYRALLEREVALRANLDQYATKDELSRRERFEVRSLGEEQVAIADELATVRTETAELAEARVFDFAQTALERDAAEAAGALRDARAADAIPPADAAIATLSMLVRALEDAERQNNPFDDDNAGGGGGGGGAGQGQQPAIMPIHELKLLREMQATLLQRTRIAETAQNAAASERIAKDQTQLHTLGAELLQRIQSQSQGPMPPMRPEQAPTPEDRNPTPPEAEQTPEPTNLPEGTEAPSHAA
jgi:hypothetical protein